MQELVSPIQIPASTWLGIASWPTTKCRPKAGFGEQVLTSFLFQFDPGIG
jgi:hypothetical protein